MLAMSADDSVSVTDGATVDLFRTWNAKAHWSAGRRMGKQRRSSVRFSHHLRHCQQIVNAAEERREGLPGLLGRAQVPGEGAGLAILIESS